MWAFAPNHRSAFLHVTIVSNRDQAGPWREQKVRQPHQQCDYFWRKLPFIRCKASCNYRIQKSPWKTSGLNLAALTVLCHLSYTSKIALMPQTSLRHLQLNPSRKKEKLLNMLTVSKIMLGGFMGYSGGSTIRP